MTSPQDYKFVIRETDIKKGLPNGGFVCFNHTVDKYITGFGETPQDAVANYVSNLAEHGKTYKRGVQ